MEQSSKTARCSLLSEGAQSFGSGCERSFPLYINHGHTFSHAAAVLQHGSNYKMSEISGMPFFVNQTILAWARHCRPAKSKGGNKMSLIFK